MNAWLVSESGDRIEIRGSLTIGRSSDNGLMLPGWNVSRKHALVHQQLGCVFKLGFVANR